MIDSSAPGISMDGCDSPFKLLLAADTSSGWDDLAIRRHKQAEDAIRWFFATALGKEVLASLTWRSFDDDHAACNFEPAGPVFRVAGDVACRLTLIMPLRCPRRGEDGELFLLVRGWRVTLGDDPGPGELPGELDNTQVEWAIIGRDPSKPRSCTAAVLHEVRALIEQQLQENLHWCRDWE